MNSRDYIEKRIAEIRARRQANPDHPQNVLERVVARNVAEHGAITEDRRDEITTPATTYSFPARVITF